MAGRGGKVEERGGECEEGQRPVVVVVGCVDGGRGGGGAAGTTRTESAGGRGTGEGGEAGRLRRIKDALPCLLPEMVLSDAVEVWWMVGFPPPLMLPLPWWWR